MAPKPNVVTFKSKTQAGKTVTKVAAACAVPSTKSANSAAQALCDLAPAVSKSGAVVPASATPPATAITPSELQAAYNLPSGTNGAGKTIAIVDALGYTNLDSDLQQFRSFYGLPPCTVANGCLQIVNENGQASPLPADGAGTGWPTETSLDVDAVSSVCPLCNITVVESSEQSLDSLANAANTAASLPGVVAISNSYGSGDSDNDPGDFSALDPDYVHPGIATLASTGDDGGNGPSWPATNPDVVAVGGTSLTQDASSPRGWNEVVWNDAEGAANSGCSTFEPQPTWQVGLLTGCSNRATADISADADPETGLALYNSEESQGGAGFQQFGGTSLSSPLVAGMFGLANPVSADTPASELAYTDPNQSTDFNDVTQGNNLVFPPCDQQLCQAGPGWDGPTGIGTPNGVAGLSNVASGTLTGTVTGPDGPIAGATITATGADGSSHGATTGADGSYTLVLADGTYDVSATAFGFSTQDVTGIVINTGDTVTQAFTLAAEQDRTISGTVTDASGQGWPMYAKITVDGAPGAVFTNPNTGKYSIRLPQDATYTFHVHAVSLPGYLDTTQSVTVGEGPVQQDIGLSVDTAACTAPGYTVNFGDGSGTNFEGWTGSTPQDGWTIQNGASTVGEWSFASTDPEGMGNETTGSGTFAVINSDFEGPGNSQDTSLVSPAMDFSSDASPSVSFDTGYDGYPGQQGDVDVSTDGGQTWTTAWQADPSGTAPFFTGAQEISLPQAANQSDVQVRFRFTGTWGFWWQLDNIVIDGNLPPGTQNCVASDNGALVEGLVKDNNTGDGLTGAKVGVTSDPNATPGVSAATPDDPALADGFYELFVPSADINASGKVGLTVSDGNYTPGSVNLAVVQGDATSKNWSLKAGHITVAVSGLSYKEQLGASKSQSVTFTNDGTEPVTVKLGEQSSKFTPLLKSGETTPAIRIPVPANSKPYALASASAKSGAKAANPDASVQPADSPWAAVANQPAPLLDQGSTSLNGLVYEFGGVSNGVNLTAASVYDPSSDSWTSLAPMPSALEKPNVETADGEIYIMGGADSLGNIDNTVYQYDPGSNTYTQVASMPTGEWAAASASLNGLVYVIGGCTTDFCSPVTTAVQIYDPSSNTWTTGANYPESDAFSECQGIGSNIICAGGDDVDSGAESASTYSYDPASNAWTQEASMPFTQWGGVSAGANGQLQVAQGFSNNEIINSAEQYDPATNAWSTLPNANVAVARGAGACGFYSLGGTDVGGGFTGVTDDEVLPGFDSCGIVDVPWLSESSDQFTIAAGASTTVTVTADSSQVDQPGTYDSGLSIQTDSPYSVPTVSVSLDVTPPASWGKINGTVTSAKDGSPIAGATIQICTQYVAKTGLCGQQTFTLKTGADGSYQLWLSHGYSPMQLVAAKDGFQPQVKVVKLPKGATVTTNFSLQAS